MKRHRVKFRLPIKNGAGFIRNRLKKRLFAVIRILAGMDHPDKRKVAEEIVNSILTENPQSVEGCYAMAMLLHLTERKKEAIPWYEKTIRLDPQHVIAMNNLAWILCTEKSEFRKALEIAQKGLELHPSYVDLIDTRGVILYASWGI